MNSNLHHVLEVFGFLVIKVKIVFFIYDFGNQTFFHVFAENLSKFAKNAEKITQNLNL